LRLAALSLLLLLLGTARVVAGVPAYRVLDINSLPELVGSDPADFIEVGGVLYFTAELLTTGRELWRTDGTAAGTWMVRAIDPSCTGSAPFQLVELNGDLVFRADDGTHGSEPWASDGTYAGTRLLLDVNPGAPGSGAGLHVRGLGSVALFAANDGANGQELWGTDGTAAGTQLVKDFYSGTKATSLIDSVVAGGRLFFSARDDTGGVEP